MLRRAWTLGLVPKLGLVLTLVLIAQSADAQGLFGEELERANRFGEEKPAERVTIKIQCVAQDPNYGYTSDNPVLIGGAESADVDNRVAEYFEILRSASGEALSYTHDGSCCSFDIAEGGAGFLQVFKVAAEGGRPTRVFVNGYAEGPLFAPRGLAFTKDKANITAVEESIEALEISDHWHIETLLKPLAEGGDLLAQYYLARAYTELGDFTSAFSWLEKAAESGHTLSQYALFNVYRSGQGVVKNKELSNQWLRQAAADGHAAARVLLAHTLLRRAEGKDDFKDPELLLRLAAEQGDSTAQGAYGVMLVNGRGTRQNLTEGMMWLFLASRSGDRNALEYYNKLAAEHPGRLVARVTFSAEDWRERPAPPAPVDLAIIPYLEAP